MNSLSKNPFNPDAGEFITGDAARKMQNAYLSTQEKLEKNPSRSVFFGIKKLNRLLKKSNAVAGLRIYFVRNENGQLTTVLTAADKNGKDIILDKSTMKDDGDNYLDMGPICPQNCPPQ